MEAGLARAISDNVLLELGHGGRKLLGILDRHRQHRPGQKAPLTGRTAKHPCVAKIGQQIVANRKPHLPLDPPEFARKLLIGGRIKRLYHTPQLGVGGAGRQLHRHRKVCVGGHTRQVRFAQHSPPKRHQHPAVRRRG